MAIEAGVFRAFDFGDCRGCCRIISRSQISPLGAEHFAEFEGVGPLRDPLAACGVDLAAFFGGSDWFRGGGALEEDGRAAELFYLVHFLAIKGDYVVAGVVVRCRLRRGRGGLGPGLRLRPSEDI